MFLLLTLNMLLPIFELQMRPQDLGVTNFHLKYHSIHLCISLRYFKICVLIPTNICLFNVINRISEKGVEHVPSLQKRH